MQEKQCLGKFTPKQNLNFPIKYDYVYRLKKIFQMRNYYKRWNSINK